MAADEEDKQQKKCAPSHLLIFHIVTAGKNGEKLGSDEEQTVLLTYLLYDVANRKVVCVQSHVTRPSGGVDELCDGALTEDCKAETGLTDEDLLRGKPLHVVLNELDQILVTKGIHPDHNGNRIALVTDGQLHLRLGLHAEASKKRLPLQSYFYSFCDLRKDVQKFFNTGSVKNIDDMLYYLMLEGSGRGTGVEYGVNKCHDMVTIIACLIDAGCNFNNPEQVTKGFEPAIYMSSDLIEDDRVIKARGLPWQASDHDIARFFSGLNVSKGGVAVCLSKNGRRNGEALIYFENAQQRELALRKHKHHIGSRYVELYPGTGKEFIQIAGCASARVFNFLSRRGVANNQSIVRMRGLPFSTKTAEIKEFFASGKHSVQVLDGDDGVLYVYHPDGRPTGDAFVLFGSDADASKALKKHCKESIGSRYIELYKSTPVEVTQVINKCADVENLKKEGAEKKNQHGDHLPLSVPHGGAMPAVSSAGGLLPGLVHTLPPPSPVTPPFPTHLTQPPPHMPLQPLTNMNNLPLQPINTNTMPLKTINNNLLPATKLEGRKDCLHVQNLPLEANMANILAFLDDLARKATSVHIMYDMHGLPRGEAIIQMDSSESAKLAEIQTSGKQIIFNSKNYVLEATQISKEEMFSKAVSPSPAPTTNFQQQQQQQTFIPQIQALQQQNLPLGGGQIMYHQLMQQVAISGSNQTYQMALPMWYPSAAVPTSTASPLAAAAIQQAQQAALLQQLQQQQQQFGQAALSPLGQQAAIIPPKIANPTTVVVKGLPQGVSVSNIRAFFKGIYESIPDIQIVMGPDGKPAGEVRVTFGSRPEAERAIIECNQKMIGNRCIELHMA